MNFEIKKYPDSSSYAVVKLIKKNLTEYVKGLTFRLNTYEDLWHLNQIVDAYNTQGVTPIITIPNLIDAQADRRFKKSESFGLKLVLKHLINMNANFKIFHPHNSEVVEMAFEICDKKVEIIDNSEFIIKVLEEINHIQEINEPDMVVLLPDGGAYKWGVKLCDKINFSGDVIAAAKNRKFIDGTSILTQQLPDYDFEGKDVLIIDDSCIYGGTFTGLSSMLREQGCNKLYLAVSHITVQNHEKYNVFQYFDKVFTTNSKYNMYYERIDGNSGAEIKNLEIIKMF